MFRRPLMLCEGLERGPARRAVLDLLQGARDPQLALATGDVDQVARMADVLKAIASATEIGEAATS